MRIEVSFSSVPIWIDFVGALGSIATAAAVIVAVFSAWQVSFGRNLSAVAGILQSLQESHAALARDGWLDLNEQEISLFQHLNFLESTCWLVRNGGIKGRARAFLMDWLDSEIPALMKSADVRRIVDGEGGRNLRARFKSSSLMAMPCQPPHENADMGDEGPCC